MLKANTGPVYNRLQKTSHTELQLCCCGCYLCYGSDARCAVQHRLYWPAVLTMLGPLSCLAGNAAVERGAAAQTLAPAAHKLAGAAQGQLPHEAEQLRSNLPQIMQTAVHCHGPLQTST